MAEKTSENIVIEILKNQQRVAIKAAVIASVAAAKAKRGASTNIKYQSTRTARLC